MNSLQIALMHAESVAQNEPDHAAGEHPEVGARVRRWLQGLIVQNIDYGDAYYITEMRSLRGP